MHHATSWFFTNSSTMSLQDGPISPQDNFVKESAVRKAIFQELAPHLLQDQFLMDQINGYVFFATTERQKTNYRKRIEQHLQQGNKLADTDALMTMIEGMHYAASHWNLADNNALDNWLALKEEETLEGVDNISLQGKANKKMGDKRFVAKENGV